MDGDWWQGGEPRNLHGVATDAGIVLTWDTPQQAAGEVTGYQVQRWRPFEDEDSYTPRVLDTRSVATTYTDRRGRGGVLLVLRQGHPRE